MTILYAFMSVHHMMRAEKMLKEHAIACDVIPTPRAISTSCGLCIIVSADEARQAEDIFRQKEIAVIGRYEDAEKQGLYKGGGEINA